MVDIPRQFHDSKFALALATAIPSGNTTLQTIAKAIKAPWSVSIDKAWYVADRLRSVGALSHPQYGRWQITEKGRIACALLAFQAQRRADRRAALAEGGAK